MTPNQNRRAKEFSGHHLDFLAVTSLARNQHVTRHVKTGAVAIHTIEMLNHRLGRGKAPDAVWALIVKPLPYKFLVFLAIHSPTPVL